MATSSTEKKIQRIPARQRIATTDLEIISELAHDLDDEDNYATLTVDNVCIEGWQVVHVAGREFGVNPGKGIVAGTLLKDIAQISLGEQDAIVDPAHDRYDVVYIDPANHFLSGTSDNAAKTVMSAVSMTSVVAEAVGTGDGAQKTWDLINSGVDPATLKVKVGGSQEHGGFDFSQGTGGAGVDQIIFATAPGVLAITADYDYLSGGVEAGASVATRYTRNSYAQVKKGTESATPSIPTPPAGSLQLAVIHYGVGWATGAPTSIDNTVKEFLVTHDSLAEPSGTTHTPNKTLAGYWAGKITHPIRKIHGIVEGFRLYWSSATEIGVTGGFAICEGVACRSNAVVTFSPVWAVDINSQAWYYCYLVIAPTNTTRPGSAPTLLVTTTPPDFMARKITSTGYLYVGAIYNDNAGAVQIREFFHNGDLIMWAGPSNLAMTHATDLDIAAWVPVTGRLAYVALYVTWDADALGDTARVNVQSHLVATGSVYPHIQTHLTAVNNSFHSVSACGLVRAEQDGATRKIHGDVSLSAGSLTTYDVRVLGYVDDCRTMGSTSATVISH